MRRRQTYRRWALPAAAVTVGGLAAGSLLVARWSQWGSTPEERAAPMPGDACLGDGPPPRVTMTRAIDLAAPPERVWPWLAQLGRGAGWYSIDRIDNGGRTSARHLVTWIPPPRAGDTTAIGYLRYLEPGRGLTWWVPGERFLGATTRMVIDLQVVPRRDGSRLIVRISADATGRTAPLVVCVFVAIDSIMARRQLLGIRERVELRDIRGIDSDLAETGARDQYQLYEVIYASGDRAGIAGREKAARWRRAAIEDGILDPSEAVT